MRVTLEKLLEKLGVPHMMAPYESCPWSYYDAAQGLACIAEVRMGGDGDEADEVEAEIQLLYDSPPEDKSAVEQICTLRGVPVGDGQWTVKTLLIRGAPYAQDVYDWEGRGCDFFRMAAEQIQQAHIPDIDELLDEAFYSYDRYGDQTGEGGGGRAPRIHGGDVFGIKKDTPF